MNSLANLYDMVLCKRMTLWFSPFREQAGSQRNRGCIEHIVTLRLLIDYAFCKRKKLFIVFLDVSKAYDRVRLGEIRGQRTPQVCEQKTATRTSANEVAF